LEALILLSIIPFSLPTEEITVEHSKSRRPSFKILAPVLPDNFFPWFVTGYADAESCFFIHIVKRHDRKNGYAVQLRFTIHIDVADISLLYLIKKFFNCGTISPVDKFNSIDYTVTDISSIQNIIVPFFRQYPLRGTKYLDFLDWVEAVNIIATGEHLSLIGIENLIKLKSNMNKKRNVPINYQPNHTIPSHSSYVPLDGNYVSGFMAGDGAIAFETISRFGRFAFQIIQHVNNRLLLESFTPLFNLTEPPINHNKFNNSIEFKITHRQSLSDIVVPFFKLYPLYGVKSITFLKLIDILAFMENDNHRSISGKGRPWKPEVKEKALNIWVNSDTLLLVTGLPGKKGWVQVPPSVYDKSDRLNFTLPLIEKKNKIK
jgi:hypothetical protein